MSRRSAFASTALVFPLALMFLWAAEPARAAEPDLSTPKKAALAWAVAVEKGDEPVMRALSTGTEEDFKNLQVVSDGCKSYIRLAEGLVAKFGEPGKIPVLAAPMSLVMNRREEKVEGDTATLFFTKGAEPDKSPIRMTKAGGVWKVDLTALDADPVFRKNRDNIPARIKAMDALTADIAAGKFKDAQEARRAVIGAISEAPKPAK